MNQNLFAGMFLPRPKKRRKCFQATVSTSSQKLNAYIGGVAVFEFVNSLLVFNYFYKIFFIESMDYIARED